MSSHIHKYQRTTLGYPARINTGKPTYWVFRCMLANCPHYVPEALIVGRSSLCHRCGKEFIMTLKESKMKKPHCRECTYSREINHATK